MDARWRIQLLGGLRATQGDREVTRFRSQKTGALLAYLAYHLRRCHPREVLIDLFWPESDPDRGRQSLSMALSSLRHQLEPPGVPAGSVIVADRASVRLNPSAVTTDVEEFEETLQPAARAADATERTHSLIRAVGLYQGELLPGYYEDWIGPAQQRLAECYFQALQQVIGPLEEAGDLQQAIQYACLAVTADPLREEAHHELIRLRAAAGQRAAALRQYGELERILRDELDQTPSAETRALADALRSGVQVFRCSGVREGTNDQRRATISGRADPKDLNTRTPEHLNTFPTGTVTFLLTDIVGSTMLWERTGKAFQKVLAEHHALLRREFRRYDGYEAREIGDGFLVAFRRVGDALSCAIACRRALAAQCWPEAIGPIGVRMVVHTGEVELENGEYRGLILHHASRILAAARGGQTLCSEVTAGLLRRRALGGMEPGVELAELGVYRLRDLSSPERLFQINSLAMAQREFPPLEAEPGYTSHLPLQLTRFFGREQELAQIVEMLRGMTTDDRPRSTDHHHTTSPPHHLTTPLRRRDARLVTLTGPGGSGKTRLALEAAAQLLEAFHGAVWFAPLADLREPERIVDAVRDALRPGTGSPDTLPHPSHPSPRSWEIEPLEQVVATLSPRPALLVLDNFEHLVAEGTQAVRTLLGRVPTLTCLVTSRRRLGLAGERVLAVPPLPTPGAGGEVVGWCGGESRSAPHDLTTSPPHHLRPEHLMQFASVQLFVDRAQAVRPDFQVTERNAAAVVALCSRLEGLPLALELAAARTQALSPAQILAQLEHRFDFLVSRRRDEEARHRNLRVATDWSYQLLAPQLQRFFARLSVFRGGFTLEAAEAVCEEKVSSGQLAEGSQEPSGLPSAYRPLPTDALDYLEQLRECSLVEVVESGEEMRYRLLETLREYAWERLREAGEAEVVRQRHRDWFLKLAERAEHELQNPKQSEWLDRMVVEHDNLRASLDWSLESGAPEAALRLGGALGRFWLLRGFLAEGRERLEALLQLPGASAKTEICMKVRYAAAVLARDQGDYVAARSLLAENLATHRAAGDTWNIANSLNNLGMVAQRQGDCAAAQSFYEESLVLWRELGATHEITLALNNLGVVTHTQGDYGAAHRLFERSLAISRELGDRRSIAWTLYYLADLVVSEQDYATARCRYEECLATFRELGDNWTIASLIGSLATMACHQRDYAAACSLFQESLALYRKLGSQQGVALSLDALGSVACRRGDYAAARAFFEGSLAIYRELGAESCVVAALRNLGGVARCQGDYEAARTRLDESLEIGRYLTSRSRSPQTSTP